MLSYQHAFHAGNHADVLKHIVLIAVLEKLNKKEKPYFALDTHAGTGIYDLSKVPEKADPSAFTKLAHTQIQLSALNAYVSLIDQLKAKSIYPGSPFLLSYFSRAQDNIHVNELSAPMFQMLEEASKVCNAYGQKLHLHQRDGFEVLKALTPPTPNRGLVLIDPPYEQIIEYQDVVNAVSQALTRWRNGTFLIWYPLLSPTRINRNSKTTEANPKAAESAIMLTKLSQLLDQKSTGGMLSIEFVDVAPSEKRGMYGSGVCLINPPYQTEQVLAELLIALQQHVQSDSNTMSRLTWYVKPT